MDGTTAFRVLGVSPGASKQTIKKAFRRLAQSAHPDVSGNAEAFVRLKDAYDLAYSSAQSEVSGRSDVADTTEDKAPLSDEVAQLLDSPKALRPRTTRLVRPNAPWLTTVLADFPATATYESLIVAGARRADVASVTHAAKQRESDFAMHLAKAMADAA